MSGQAESIRRVAPRQPASGALQPGESVLHRCKQPVRGAVSPDRAAQKRSLGDRVLCFAVTKACCVPEGHCGGVLLPGCECRAQPRIGGIGGNRWGQQGCPLKRRIERAFSLQEARKGKRQTNQKACLMTLVVSPSSGTKPSAEAGERWGSADLPTWPAQTPPPSGPRGSVPGPQRATGTRSISGYGATSLEVSDMMQKSLLANDLR